MFFYPSGIDHHFYDHIRAMFHRAPVRHDRTCPGCSNKLLEIEYRRGGLLIDMCPHCHGLWFDHGERAHLTRLIHDRLGLTEINLSKSGRQEDLKVRQIYSRYQQAVHAQAPEATLGEIAFQVLTSLPLERNLKPLRSPWLTRALVVINVLIFALSTLGLGCVARHLVIDALRRDDLDERHRATSGRCRSCCCARSDPRSHRYRCRPGRWSRRCRCHFA